MNVGGQAFRKDGRQAVAVPSHDSFSCFQKHWPQPVRGVQEDQRHTDLHIMKNLREGSLQAILT